MNKNAQSYVEKSMPVKISAATLIEDAGVYELMRIKVKECNTKADNTDSGSVGHAINKKLQPALERLAAAVVLEKKVPSFESSALETAKEDAVSAIKKVASLRNNNSDGQAVDGLVKQLGNMTELPDVAVSINKMVDRLVDAIKFRLQEKDMVMALANGRGNTGHAF